MVSPAYRSRLSENRAPALHSGHHADDHETAGTARPLRFKDASIAVPPLRRQAAQEGAGKLRVRAWGTVPETALPSALGPQDGMKSGEDARGARGEGLRKLALCVLCGLPAAGKSTLARALSHQLRQEQNWAVGVVAYDDVMPDAFLEEASARPLVGGEGAGPRLRRRKEVRMLLPCALGDTGCGRGRPRRGGTAGVPGKWSWFNLG